jgi:hypothetical protein
MTGGDYFVAALLACLALAGCEDPYTQSTPTAGESPRPDERRQAERPRGDELPPPAPPSARPSAFSEAPRRRSARGALEAFCSQWANWSWRTIERQQRRLARLAAGRLAAELAAEARQAKLDRALRRDRLAMRGLLVAVDLDPPASPGRAVCVTREREIQNGRGELGGGRHRAYLATLDRDRQGWGVSAWQPQP